MKIFSDLPKTADLRVIKDTDEMVLFEPFLLSDPYESDKFPPSDEPYYTALEMTLRHLLFKFDKGWIDSERQVIYSSDECISTIHFTFDEDNDLSQINVFQRSSNMNNLRDDVMFFNYFIAKYAEHPFLVDLNIFVSMPHIFKNKNKKIED